MGGVLGHCKSKRCWMLEVRTSCACRAGRRAAHRVLGGCTHWDGKGGRGAHRLHTGGVVGGDPSCYRCERCVHAVLGDRQRVGPSHSGWEGRTNIQCHGCARRVRAARGQPMACCALGHANHWDGKGGIRRRSERRDLTLLGRGTGWVHTSHACQAGRQGAWAFGGQPVTPIGMARGVGRHSTGVVCVAVASRWVILFPCMEYLPS